MMKKLYKTLCLVLALSVSMLLFTGCEKKPGLYAWYGGKMNVDTVMTIRVDGGEGEKVYEVPFDTYRAVFLYLKANVSDYIMNEDSEYTGLSTDAEKTAAIKEVAENILTDYYCLVTLCEKYDIRITDEDKQQYYNDTQKKIQDYLADIDEEKMDFKGTKEEYAAELYKKSLAVLNMTPEYFEFTYYRSLLEQRLKKVMSPDIGDYINQSYYHYEQILFTYTKGDAAAEEQARKNILSVQEKLQSGAEMSTVAKDYTPQNAYRDIYFDINGKVVGSPYGETLGSFTRDALCALDSGEYSEIMSGDQDDYIGYFVILHKLDIDTDYVCGTDPVAKLIYQYPYVGSSSYSAYYSKYNTMRESYVQNSSLIPVSEKVYNRISVKTLY
ncbi:MAG: hypothetical protein E7603_00885 [Ruminococcaceae bacterium]|nr:hypothetical protein [Oscillospiraceae bacterium]